MREQQFFTKKEAGIFELFLLFMLVTWLHFFPLNGSWPKLQTGKKYSICEANVHTKITKKSRLSIYVNSKTNSMDFERLVLFLALFVISYTLVKTSQSWFT